MRNSSRFTPPVVGPFRRADSLEKITLSMGTFPIF
jgi:hypothetical protein